MVRKLNEVSHLRNTGFGRPRPRHGLKLLHWFANECLIFDNNNNMFTECDPADGDFGFHLFKNRSDEYGNKLLPNNNVLYYVVGNLNSAGAEDLPESVTEDKYTGEDDSNTDRIIVSLHDDCEFDEVYISQHQDRSNYDPNNTYQITKGLLMIIKRMRLEDFLQKMGYYPYTQPIYLMPYINIRPETTNTAGPETVITVPSRDPPHYEAPAAQNSETIITMGEETPTKNPSEYLPKKKSVCERLCTIL
ncbi:uncharacterized protein LOC130221748 [Danio aesculapii]|uniref:uncharacterized protein LOC130221748 n=1 Tax=Danio aesculapii TaxID=1142201 RepID=UPI0024BF8F43|nr:uncharacterized protein LOC130221748 [Danio aesculapii]